MYFKEDARITDEGYLKTYNIFRVGDIAFEGNKSNDFSHGRFVENTIGDGIVSHVFVVFKPLHDTHNLRYWKYAINNESVMGRILARCTKKTTMMTNLVTKDFLNQSIPCPSAQEQDKIASLLDTISKRIELQKLYVESLKKYKRGVTRRLFAQEKGSFETDLQMVSLGDLFPFIRNGFVGTVTPFFTDREHGVRYLQGTNIHAGKITDDTVYYVTKDFNAKHSKNILKRDDILVVQSGHVGECAVVGKEYEGANCHALIIMSNGGNCFSDYVAQYINSEAGNKQIASITTGNTIRHILASAIADRDCQVFCVSF